MTPIAVVSVSPVVLASRARELHVRISAPITGSQLPVIVFAHGFGSSLDGYAPLVSYWAARGFVVIQPTFLDSRRSTTKSNDAIWRTRVEDVKRVLDELALLESAAPGLAGRVDRRRIAAVGHSFGAQTTAALLGARVLAGEQDSSDVRIQVGVLLCAGGHGDLTPFAEEHLPHLNQTYAHMHRPALIVAGDRDQSPLTVRGPDWFTDAYFDSPDQKALLTLHGGEHMLGGISGELVTETTDENPERVAVVQRLTWAYLQSAFEAREPAWSTAIRELDPKLGHVESK